MKQTCKVCYQEYLSDTDLVRHHNFAHKLSSASLFTCGVEDCSVRFATQRRYSSHLIEYHGSGAEPVHSTGQGDECQNAANEEMSLTYKCPYPLCEYTCKSKETLRVHRHRKHPGQKPRTPESSNSSVGALHHTQEEDSVADCEIPAPSIEETLPVQSGDCVVPVTEEEQNLIVQKFLHLYLSLNSKFHLTESVVQYVIDTYQFLLHESFSILKREIFSALMAGGKPALDSRIKDVIESAISNNIAQILHSSDGPLRSSYIRKKNFHSEFPFISPKPHFLGLDENNRPRKYYTVPLKASLTALLSDVSISQQYEESKCNTYSSDVYRDISDGSVWQDMFASTDASTIKLLVYSDDLEIFSALGSAKTVHKVTNIYVAVANLHPWSRFKAPCILLALTCREKDVAYFGLEKVLAPLIKELKDLQKNGICINGNLVKVRLLFLIGDNLGTHTITGFTENFSTSLYFCRYCEESRKEWKARWKKCDTPQNVEEESDSEIEEEESDSGSEEDSGDSEEEESGDGDSISEDDASSDSSSENANHVHQNPDVDHIPDMPPLRSEYSYDDCFKKFCKNKNPKVTSIKGVVGYCEFNKIPCFHCIGRCPPCIAHDMFEGFAARDVSLALKYFELNFNITAEYINRKLMAFKFLGRDSNDKPSKVSEKMKICGNAVQNWVFIRFLPLLVGDKISNKSDKVWQMVLLLIRILQKLCSPVIAKRSLPKLKSMIRCYLYLRTTLFPNIPLRPKHHFFEHYPTLIEMFGPLMRVCTLAFESKHPFFQKYCPVQKKLQEYN